MIRFCIGSVFKVMSFCRKGRTPNDDELADILFECTGVTDYNHQYIAHIKDCTKNLPPEIAGYFASGNIADKIDDIKESCLNVYNCLPTDGREKVTAAIVDIIRHDTGLSDVPFGNDPRYKPGQIKTADKFEPVDFLANVIIGVCRSQNDYRDESGISELTKEYIDDCRSTANFRLVDSVDQLDPVEESNTDANSTASAQTMNQYNYGGVVINNPHNINFVNHVDTMRFD